MSEKTAAHRTSVVLAVVCLLLGCDSGERPSASAPTTARAAAAPIPAPKSVSPAAVPPAPAPPVARHNPLATTPPIQTDLAERLRLAKAQHVAAQAAVLRAADKAAATFDAGPGKAITADMTAKAKVADEARLRGSPEQLKQASAAWTAAKKRLDDARPVAVKNDPGRLSAVAREQAARDAVARATEELAAWQQAQADEQRRKEEEIREKEYAAQAAAQAKERRRREPIGTLSVGAEGQINVRVFQVVNDSTFLGDCGNGVTVWFSGWSTANMVDGHRRIISARIVGTKQYDTPLGVTRTIFEARPME